MLPFKLYLEIIPDVGAVLATLDMTANVVELGSACVVTCR